jgi:flavin reductase (DIM6/NTAB) family NADH-FMN oxidoreductase RutF
VAQRVEIEGVFDRLMASLDYPLLIATTDAGGRRAGCLVGFASQCSIDPLRFLVCLSERNRTFRVAAVADSLAIHGVSQEESDLAELFGGKTGDDVDKFARCDWSAGPAGIPILDRAPAWFVGSIVSTGDVGDHIAFLLEPVAAELRRPFHPLPLSYAAELAPGHAA